MSEMDNRLGSRYVLKERLGRGAMGTVWRATNNDTGVDVAVKVLSEELSDEPEMVVRFVQERNALVAVRHPNLVRIHDLVVEDGRLAIIMDLINGPDLHRHLAQRGTLNLTEAAIIGRGVASALESIHTAGIIHRDLKPANILLDLGGPQPEPKLVDFGIARMLSGSRLTARSSVVGTPQYLSPEAISGAEPTPAVDIYALGIALYELFTGEPPFHGDQLLQVLNQHMYQEPPWPPSIPPQILPLLQAMLAKNPQARPTAPEIARSMDALVKAAPQPAAAATPGNAQAGQFQQSQVPGQIPPSALPGQPALPGAPGQSALAAAPGRPELPGAPGQSPLPGAPGQYPQNQPPGQSPLPGAPGQFPQSPAPGQSPLPGAPGQFPQNQPPGQSPLPGAPIGSPVPGQPFFPSNAQPNPYPPLYPAPAAQQPGAYPYPQQGAGDGSSPLPAPYGRPPGTPTTDSTPIPTPSPSGFFYPNAGMFDPNYTNAPANAPFTPSPPPFTDDMLSPKKARDGGRKRLLIGVGAVLAVAAVGGLVFALTSGSSPKPQPVAIATGTATGTSAATGAASTSPSFAVDPTCSTQGVTAAARWLLDGTPAACSSSTGSLNLFGNATWASVSSEGMVLKLNGQTSRATIPIGSIVNTARSFTVSAWVELSSTLKSTQTVVAFQGEKVDAFKLQYDASQKTWVFSRSSADVAGAQWTAAGAKSPVLGSWTHLVGVYNAGAHSISLYVNGTDVAHHAGGSGWQANGKITIGASLDSSGNPFETLDGEISQVEIFDSALTSAQVASLP